MRYDADALMVERRGRAGWRLGMCSPRRSWRGCGAFPEITRAELIRCFTLSEQDETFVRQFRGPANVLGVAVQLCTLPWLGFVPDDVRAAPPVAVGRLAGRLDLPVTELSGYARAEQIGGGRTRGCRGVRMGVMFENGESSPATVYQLRVVVRGISPLIWRRLLVPADTTIAELHAILQTVFGWSGEHLHRFLIHGREYGISYVGGPGFRDDARTIRLGELGLRRSERFTLRVQLLRRLAGRPARGADPRPPAGSDLPALYRRSPRRPTRGLGRALGLPGADPAVSGVRRPHPRRGDRAAHAGRRRRGRPRPASAWIVTSWPPCCRCWAWSISTGAPATGPAHWP